MNEVTLEEQIAWVEREIEFLEEEDDKEDDLVILREIYESLNRLNDLQR